MQFFFCHNYVLLSYSYSSKLDTAQSTFSIFTKLHNVHPFVLNLLNVLLATKYVNF